ncbi:hypothetical protein CDL15_Pgr027134 [Punica granatum]|uniref:Uncharacterized protein n=1 Tax=Punica granatum TaxID=22663 RepID=A0A218Y3H2_PUNGR|nr:hypothetical protein CDL15_Pgr027134 [Punica granatum]
MTPEQESSRDIPEGFAICTWRIPNEQHGSKAPTQWTCGVQGALLGGWYGAGKFKVGMDPKGTDPRAEQNSSRNLPEGNDPCLEKWSGRTRSGRTPVQKSGPDVPEGDDP